MKFIYSFLLLFSLLLASNRLNDSVQNIKVIAKNLSVPWQLAFTKDGRIFFTQRDKHTVRIISKEGRLLKEPWLNLQAENIYQGGESGLLGIAIDKDFRKNKFVYLSFNYKKNNFNYNKLVRYKERNQKGIFDKILLDNIPAAYNHNGGRLLFGIDNKLYWGIGDRNVPNIAQNLKSLNGKILRLNNDGSIPIDNPFKNSYVYSYGHRNVQGLTFNPFNKMLYSTEHGPSGWIDCCQDEVNLILPGKNYGWPIIRGNEKQKNLLSPLIHSGKNTTWAPSGATFVKSGKWKGSLLFVGLRGQAIYRIIFNQDYTKVSKLLVLFKNRFGRLRDIAISPLTNKIYIATSNLDGRGNPQKNDDKIIMITP